MATAIPVTPRQISFFQAEKTPVQTPCVDDDIYLQVGLTVLLGQVVSVSEGKYTECGILITGALGAETEFVFSEDDPSNTSHFGIGDQIRLRKPWFATGWVEDGSAEPVDLYTL